MLKRWKTSESTQTALSYVLAPCQHSKHDEFYHAIKEGIGKNKFGSFFADMSDFEEVTLEAFVSYCVEWRLLGNSQLSSDELKNAKKVEDRVAQLDKDRESYPKGLTYLEDDFDVIESAQTESKAEKEELEEESPDDPDEEEEEDQEEDEDAGESLDETTDDGDTSGSGDTSESD